MDDHPQPNPKRVAAGRANRAKRGPLSPVGRERLRAAARRNQPWQFATGPRTAQGRAQAARNGKKRQRGELSVRERSRQAAEVRALIGAMRATRQNLEGMAE